jgi:hypothetical protein
MKEDKKTVISIKGIIYVVVAVMLLALTANLFTCNTSTRVAETTNSITNEEDNAQISVAKQINEQEVTYRGQETPRVNAQENEEITVQEEQVEQEKYITLENVSISKDMDLTIRTGLSKQDFKNLIATVKEDKSKFFFNNSDIIYELCKKYEINEIFFCGLISAESGWTIATNHRNTHNYISLMSKGKLIKYNSVEEGLEIAAKTLHNKYLTKGGTFYKGKTLAAVKIRFCPASSTWVDLVYGRMKQIRY